MCHLINCLKLLTVILIHPAFVVHLCFMLELGLHSPFNFETI